MRTRIITLLVALCFVTSAFGSLTPFVTDDRLVRSPDSYRTVDVWDDIKEAFEEAFSCDNPLFATGWACS